jgi:lipopolysaccharide transport system permease protein/teichoic acid transport system permease protein
MSYIKNFYYFNKVLFQQRYIIQKLVARDFQKKYLASYLGLPWAFLQPFSIILVLWFVVSIGLRGGDLSDGTPFLPWFISGMIPWFFIKESLHNSSSSLIDYSFLIKKMYFRVGMIPLIRIMTALIIHLFLIVILLIFVVAYGFYPTIYWLQLPYYLLCSLILLVGLGWFTSALMVFVRDVKQTLDVLLTLLFWVTPIIWPYARLQGNMRLVADLNPFFYLTNGYRETLIHGKWFFENISLTLYFWFLAIFFFIMGAFIFQKLKPHFADVL